MKRPMRLWRRRLGICTAVFAAMVCHAVNAQSADRFATAMRHFERGDFEQATALWRELNENTASNEDRARAHLGIAAASLRLGLYQEASQALADLRAEFDVAGATPLAAQYYRQLGNLQVATHRHDESLLSFATALSKLSDERDAALRAAILGEYGNALSIGGYVTDAIAAYRQSQDAARHAQLSALISSATLNLARLQFESEDVDAARTSLSEATELLLGLEPSYEWAAMQLAWVDLSRMLARGAVQNGTSERQARLERTLNYAQEVSDARLTSQIYASQAKEATLAVAASNETAQTLTRKAIFFASQASDNDLLYRWRWQLATLQRDAGALDASLDSFERALSALTPIRQELLSGYRESRLFFRQYIRPVYLDYVDVLLMRAEGDAQRPMLERARQAMEALASAELQDYFRDQCVVERQSKAMNIEQVAPHAAVLYPILLNGRIELLLSVNGELHRHSVPLEQQQLTDAAVRLREFVQDPASLRYLPYAQRLYRWVIEPIKARLIAANVDTLVVVPDGVLRTIPFAALHSGDRFLVEEFALAMTPGITLTAASPARSTAAAVLLTGVAQPVQGFAPLPMVSAELSAIREYFGGTVLENREYTKDNLQSALAAREYSIVHMATHSTVGATPADSFLLTYDGKLTMSDLEYLLRIGEFRDNPVELLTLSACETAVGDERAALGLAGIAVKSGAKSVVASLWLVEDASTASLMNRFYRNLSMRNQTAQSKAKALRAAQLNLLAEPATEHPAHWSAFALIGNWQ